MKKRKKREEGFTFIEIMAAVIIIGILSTVVGIVVFKQIGEAKRKAALSQIQTFKNALTFYFMDCGIFPGPDEGLSALWHKPESGAAASRWKGPYIEKEIPPDPWGNNYIYNSPGPNGLDFEIKSLGADGAEGGEGEAADIISWKNE